MTPSQTLRRLAELWPGTQAELATESGITERTLRDYLRRADAEDAGTSVRTARRGAEPSASLVALVKTVVETRLSGDSREVANIYAVASGKSVDGPGEGR